MTLTFLGCNVAPADQYQRVFLTVAIILGMMFNAKIFAEVSQELIVMNRKEFKQDDKVDLASKQMKNLGVPASIQKRVQKHLSAFDKFLYAQTELEYLLRSVTPSLRFEIYNHVFGRVILNYFDGVGPLVQQRNAVNFF